MIGTSVCLLRPGCCGDRKSLTNPFRQVQFAILVKSHHEYAALVCESVPTQSYNAGEHGTQVGSYIIGDRGDSRSVRAEPSNNEHGGNPQAPPQSEEEVATDLTVRTMTLRNTAVIGT